MNKNVGEIFVYFGGNRIIRNLMKLFQRSNGLYFVLTLVFFNAPALAQRVNDFALFDQYGKIRQLSYYRDSKAVALLVDAEDSNQKTKIDYQRLAKQANNKSIVFAILYSGSVENRLRLRQSFIEQDLALPVLIDDSGLVSDLLEVSHVGEVLLLDPKRYNILYRGRLGESFDLALGEITTDAPLSKNTISLSDLPFINRISDGGSDHAISYANDIAPILIQHCLVCHREKGVAPFAMDSWGVILGWSPMIKEVLLSKRMPPGQIDPAIGHFKNSRVLSSEEITKVIRWIDSGGPNDSDEDPLEEFTSPENQWAFGEPDLILNLPEQTISATGLIDYTDFVLPLPLAEQRWVRATQFVPGDQRVLHHAEAFVVSSEFGGESATNPKVFIAENFLRAYSNLRSPDTALISPYVPGGKPESLPGNTGGLLSSGSHLAIQLHYATIGRDVKDQTQLGIWFYPDDNEPRERMVVGCACIEQSQWDLIPAYDDDFVVQAELSMDDNVFLYSVLPQMHYRGSAIRFDAHLPDGNVEPILNIPKYNFNWQIDYQFAEPKFIPAGTKIVATATYDNSNKNKFNPDASQDVPWGRESYNEILAGVFQWKLAD